MSASTSKEARIGDEKVDHQEDRLSNLPNEILVKILSCLETREAVRSEILSTRWKSVWVFVPVLDLKQSDFKFNVKRPDGHHKREKARFWNFMDQVLIDRKMPCLEKIRIHGKKCDPYLLRSWISAALKRNTNELDVQYVQLSKSDIPCELTNGLFSRTKLVILKLRIHMTLNFQANSSWFPNLKVLQLDSIIYTSDDTLPNLLSSCPILEDLVIIRGGKDNLGTINFISRSVKRLKVDNKADFFGYGLEPKMVFDTPAVESIDIECLSTSEILVKDLSCIVDAKIEVLEIRSNTYKLLRDVSNVKFLTLHECTVETIVRSDAYDFPMFYNLTRLEIYGDSRCEDTPSFDGKRAKNLIWKLLIEILKCTPMIEHLIYEADDESSQKYCKASFWDVPNCLFSSLKSVEFSRCSEADVERVRYFLLNAHGLKNITIMHSFHRNHRYGLNSELYNTTFKNENGSPVTVSWYKEENRYISPLVALLIPSRQKMKW